MSLTTTHTVPADRDTVWQWHARQGSLARLSPPFFPYFPLQQADSLSSGTSILAFPAGLKWVARHDLAGYVRGIQFTDVCTNAPVRSLANWRHIHRFADAPDGGTIITDEVTTRVPGSTIAPMFAYRQHQLIGDLCAAQVFQAKSNRTLTVGLTDPRSGIGRHLHAQLSSLGHTVVPLVTKANKESQRVWDPARPKAQDLTGLDALVVGEVDHRVLQIAARTSATIVRLLPCYECVPDDPDVGARLVTLRHGLPISGNSEVLPGMRTLMSTGLSGKLPAQEEDQLHWVAIDDLCDAIVLALIDDTATGLIDAIAPELTSTSTFRSQVGHALKDFPKFPVPMVTMAPKALINNSTIAADILAFTAPVDRAVPSQHLLRYPRIDQALTHEMGGEELFDASRAD